MRFKKLAVALAASAAASAFAGVTINNQTATGITATTTQLRGDATESGGSTYNAYFEYGTTAGYGTQSPTQSNVVSPNLTSRVLSNTITGLTCGTSYHFRMVVPSVANGSDTTFSTSPCSPTLGLALTTGSTPSLYGSSLTYTATLSGATSPTGNVNFMWNGTSIQGCGAVPISGNTAQCTVNNLAVTANASVTATYFNDSLNYNATSSALSQTISAAAPGATSTPVATAGNASATVAFVGPTNTGGTTVTGYTVTSIPAGGVDQQAGTLGLTHTITGLTNGTSYQFTVTATNSAGSSVASATSNSVTPSSGATGGGAIPNLSVVIAGVKSMPTPLDLATGAGPAFKTAMMNLLGKALNTSNLTYQTQNAQGVVTVTGYGDKGTDVLAFMVSGYATGDTRADGVYPTGNGTYYVVSGGAAVTLIPAVVNLNQLTGLYPGATATVTSTGVIVAGVGGVTYSVMPSPTVKFHYPSVAKAQLMPGADDIPEFTDASNNSQLMNGAFAEPETLRSALLNMDPKSSVTIQLDGTAAVVVNGSKYTLVPDNTLGTVPSSQAGRLYWQDSPNRYHLLNLQNSGTSQGLTVK